MIPQIDTPLASSTKNCDFDFYLWKILDSLSIEVAGYSCNLIKWATVNLRLKSFSPWGATIFGLVLVGTLWSREDSWIHRSIRTDITTVYRRYIYTYIYISSMYSIQSMYMVAYGQEASIHYSSAVLITYISYTIVLEWTSPIQALGAVRVEHQPTWTAQLPIKNTKLPRWQWLQKEGKEILGTGQKQKKNI